MWMDSLRVAARFGLGAVVVSLGAGTAPMVPASSLEMAVTPVRMVAPASHAT